MKCNIRGLQYVWVEVSAGNIDHGATVYKRMNGDAYTLLERVVVGETTIESGDNSRFIHKANHRYDTISADTILLLKVTPDDIYYAVDEIYDGGSDWNK